VIERRDVDELIILDVSSLAPRFDAVSKLCDNLFCPVTIGGGVKNVNDIGRLLRCGADKVAVNRMVRESPNLVREAAERFGAQAITAALDVRSGGDDPISSAAHVQHLGAGEILLTSVERDGMMEGYDLELIRSVSSAVSIPVIAAGGCGSYEHMEQALAAGAHAVAAGAFFQFCEATPKGAARHLKASGINTRT
jgi:cyclase